MLRLSIVLSFLFGFNTLCAQFTLEDIWLKGNYRATNFSSPTWTAKEPYFSSFSLEKNTNRPIVLLQNAKTGQTIELTERFPEKNTLTVALSGYEVLEGNDKLLFSSEEEAIYRRSSKAFYTLFDVSTGLLRPIHDTSLGKISYPEVSPDKSKIAFVRNNNLFTVDLTTFEETAITTDGRLNEVINGSCDWVYEEEFEFAKAFFWSPNGNYLAYYRFDERQVREYTLQRWGGLYPEDYRYKYPKAGEDNAVLSLHCYDVKTKQTILLDKYVPGEKEYFPRLAWTGDPAVVGYYRMNRKQSVLELVHFSMLTKQANIVYREEDNAYVELVDNLHYFSGKEDFILSSERNGFRHIYKVEAGGAPQPITSGNYEVEEVFGIDEKKKLIYFSGNQPSSREKHGYSIHYPTGAQQQLTKERGVHHLTFSPSYSFYTDFYSNLTTPPSMRLVETESQTTLTELGDNSELKQLLAKEKIGKSEFFTFITQQGQALDGWMIKPVGFSPKKKYPVLVSIYGGPGHQEGLDHWRGAGYIWNQLLAQKGYIIVCVDGRGTGGKGASFKKTTQGQLGKLETQDLIETAKYLKTLSYVQPSRIGIFGWSFGGYLSTLAITKGADHFAMAIAVAPVTQWRYYDNIYTERYMGLPSENAKGYDDNSPVQSASLLRGKYLLIHGTADDNVHVQHSLEMQRALINAGKFFDVFYYPDRNHGIYGGVTRYHLYKMMTDYILKNL